MSLYKLSFTPTILIAITTVVVFRSMEHFLSSLNEINLCYRAGYMEAGVTSWDLTARGPCPRGHPLAEQWFRVDITVAGDTVRVLLNNELLVSPEPRFQATGKLGVMAPTGRGYRIFFDELELRKRKANFGTSI